MNFKASKKYCARATAFKSNEEKLTDKNSLRLPILDEDSNDESDEQPELKNNKLQQKKNKMRQLGLGLSTKAQAVSCPLSLIKEMKKLNCSDLSSKSTQSSLSYIFAKPAAAKTEKEHRMQQFLAGEGIFQINVGVVFEEYSFSSM